MKFIVEVTEAEAAVDLLLELQGRAGVDVSKMEEGGRKYKGRRTSKAAQGRTKWTDDATAQFIDMYGEGFTTKQIANKLGRSVSAIEHRMYKWDAGELFDPRNNQNKMGEDS